MRPKPRQVLGQAVGRMSLRARRLGIETQHEAVVFMRTDCHVCRSEGLSSHARIAVEAAGREIVATLNRVSSDLVAVDEVGLSEAAWRRLPVADGEPVFVRHPDPLRSMSRVRARIFGNRLGEADFREIIGDVVAGRYSDIELSSFITACSSLPLDEAETIA